MLDSNIHINPIHSVRINRGKLYRLNFKIKRQQPIEKQQLSLMVLPDSKIQLKDIPITKKYQQKVLHSFRRHSDSPLKDIRTVRTSYTPPSIPSSYSYTRHILSKRDKSAKSSKHRQNKMLKNRLNEIFNLSFTYSDSLNSSQIKSFIDADGEISQAQKKSKNFIIKPKNVLQQIK